jgi:hypothetical protein
VPDLLRVDTYQIVQRENQRRDPPGQRGKKIAPGPVNQRHAE